MPGWHCILPDMGCSVEGCVRVLLARGLCSLHYERKRRTGTTAVGERLVGAGLEQRLWFRTVVVGECWESGRALTRRVREGGNGYPGIRIGNQMVTVHLAAYRHFVGEPPAGHHVHHECGNKRCWRPEHLVALSPADHKAAHRKTECVKGHPLSGENLRVVITPEGWTINRCKECGRAARRRHGSRARRELVAS